MNDPRPHDFIHGHEPDAPWDRVAILAHNLGAVILALQSLENRMAAVEARLAAVERAIPWKAPPKPKPPKLPPRRPGI